MSILLHIPQLNNAMQDQPYSSKAVITLRGLPSVDQELPMYGSKVIAVRDGYLTLHGMHKTPTWTVLNETADIGAINITVNGAVNWVPGDSIVIASSSFYGELSICIEYANSEFVCSESVVNM